MRSALGSYQSKSNPALANYCPVNDDLETYKREWQRFRITLAEGAARHV
jgi:hypothetical protein